MKMTIIGVWGAYPKANSSTTAMLLEEDGFSLLIECGSGVLSQLQNYIAIEQLDAVILSHYHHDHIADIGALQYGVLVQSQLGNRKYPLPIYGHRQDPTKFEMLSYENYTIGREIAAEEELFIGPWQIDFCPTQHPAYCLAMRFQSGERCFVYTGDTEWSQELVHFSKSAQFLIADCSLYQQQLGRVKGHLTARQTGLLAQQAGVKSLLLTHLPHYGEHQQLVREAAEEYEGPVQMAYPGMTIQI